MKQTKKFWIILLEIKIFCNFAHNINNPQSNNQIFLFTDVRVKITLILIIYNILLGRYLG
jgi:hypothetical protein